MFIFTSFIKFAKFSAIISSKNLSVPFFLFSSWNSQNMDVSPLDGAHKSFRVYSLFKIFFFLFLTLDNFHHSIFKLTDCFFCLLKYDPHSLLQIFHFSIVLFSSKSSFWFLFRFFISLLIFYFHTSFS